MVITKGHGELSAARRVDGRSTLMVILLLADGGHPGWENNGLSIRRFLSAYQPNPSVDIANVWPGNFPSDVPADGRRKICALGTLGGPHSVLVLHRTGKPAPHRTSLDGIGARLVRCSPQNLARVAHAHWLASSAFLEERMILTCAAASFFN